MWMGLWQVIGLGEFHDTHDITVGITQMVNTVDVYSIFERAYSSSGITVVQVRGKTAYL
jgi:hypothetical protein